MGARSGTRGTRARGWLRAGVEARGRVLSYLLTESGRPRGPPARQPQPAWPLGSISGAIGEELGGLVWGGGVRALRLLVQFEEHLLLPLLLVQIIFQSLRQREGRWGSDPIGHRSSDLRTPPGGLLWEFPSWALVPGSLVFPLSLPRAYHPESKHHPLRPPATATQEFPVSPGLQFGAMPVYTGCGESRCKSAGRKTARGAEESLR